ncbi:Putative ribonuclease H protein At1g65750 [Linum perenne]
MRAEIRGIVEGMRLAWERGIRKLSIQTDSRAAVALLTAGDDRRHRHASLVQQFHELRMRDWDVKIHHIYREANYAADYMANLGQSLDFGVHVSDNPGWLLKRSLNFDQITRWSLIFKKFLSSHTTLTDYPNSHYRLRTSNFPSICIRGGAIKAATSSTLPHHLNQTQNPKPKHSP